MGAQAKQAQPGLERCWRAANRQMQSCAYGAKIKSVSKARTFTLEPRRSRNYAAFGHYLLNSFRVLRSSTTYAIEARMPLPERWAPGRTVLRLCRPAVSGNPLLSMLARSSRREERS